MIDLRLDELLLWMIGITFIVVGLLRLFSMLRRMSANSKSNRSIYYCNVCVEYFKNEGQPKHSSCPTCQRKARRGNRT